MVSQQELSLRIKQLEQEKQKARVISKTKLPTRRFGAGKDIRKQQQQIIQQKEEAATFVEEAGEQQQTLREAKVELGKRQELQKVQDAVHIQVSRLSPGEAPEYNEDFARSLSPAAREVYRRSISDVRDRAIISAESYFAGIESKKAILGTEGVSGIVGGTVHFGEGYQGVSTAEGIAVEQLGVMETTTPQPSLSRDISVFDIPQLRKPTETKTEIGRTEQPDWDTAYGGFPERRIETVKRQARTVLKHLSPTAFVEERQVWAEELREAEARGDISEVDRLMSIGSTRELTDPGIRTRSTVLGLSVLPFGAAGTTGAAAFFNYPKLVQAGEETRLTRGRQKELNIEIEEYNEDVAEFKEAWGGKTVGKEFVGTEREFEAYSAEFKELGKKEEEIKELETEIRKRKATGKELLTEFGVGVGTAAVFSGALFGASKFLKFGAEKVGSIAPPFVGKGLDVAGKGVSKGTSLYFQTEFFGEGIDIGKSVVKEEFELAKLKGAGLVGSIAGFMGGKYAAEKGFDTAANLYAGRGIPTAELVDPSTKPFFKVEGGIKTKVFMRRYGGYKPLKIRSYKPAITNILGITDYKKGQFLRRQTPIVPPEVMAHLKGKKTAKIWVEEGKDFVQVTVPAKSFPYDDPSTHLDWALRKQRLEGIKSPGITPESLKGKPYGFSATDIPWKDTKFEPGVFKYSGGELDLPGAYQYYSFKGFSPYFFRIGKGKKYSFSLSDEFSSETNRPTGFVGYFEGVKESKALGEVKGTVGERDLKVYLLNEKMKEGIAYLPLMKREVEGVTAFSERFPVRKYKFKLLGKQVIVEEQTFSKKAAIEAGVTEPVGKAPVSSEPIVFKPTKISLYSAGKGKPSSIKSLFSSSMTASGASVISSYKSSGSKIRSYITGYSGVSSAKSSLTPSKVDYSKLGESYYPGLPKRSITPGGYGDYGYRYTPPEELLGSGIAHKKIKLSRKSSLKSPREEPGWNVFVKPTKKVKGKQEPYKKINKRPTTKQRALDFGAYATDTSLARTFEIRPAKGKGSSELSVPVPGGYFNNNREKFRDYRVRKGKKVKRSSTRYIEKGTKLLDTPQEVQGINLRKRLAQLRKGRKK